MLQGLVDWGGSTSTRRSLLFKTRAAVHENTIGLTVDVPTCQSHDPEQGNLVTATRSKTMQDDPDRLFPGSIDRIQIFYRQDKVVCLRIAPESFHDSGHLIFQVGNFWKGWFGQMNRLVQQSSSTRFGNRCGPKGFILVQEVPVHGFITVHVHVVNWVQSKINICRCHLAIRSFLQILPSGIFGQNIVIFIRKIGEIMLWTHSCRGGTAVAATRRAAAGRAGTAWHTGWCCGCGCAFAL
mmetsp:Transcript_814/g.1670  ORF Transcript_814/g.1670 Transcript_814/m.1670 type:complete len:239 (-) Transcript_814:909-1625(-)